MQRETEPHYRKLIEEGQRAQSKDARITEREDGSGIRRRWIDLGTANLGSDDNGRVLHSSPGGLDKPLSARGQISRRIPRV